MAPTSVVFLEGERKRVAVGTELVADVSVLLLDEPTSGLDAFAALNLVKNLKEITRERDLYTLMTITSLRGASLSTSTKSSS